MTHRTRNDQRKEISNENKSYLNHDNPFTSSSCGASTTVIVIAIAVVVVIGLIALTCAGS